MVPPPVLLQAPGGVLMRVWPEELVSVHASLVFAVLQVTVGLLLAVTRVGLATTERFALFVQPSSVTPTGAGRQIAPFARVQINPKYGDDVLVTLTGVDPFGLLPVENPCPTHVPSGELQLTTVVPPDRSNTGGFTEIEQEVSSVTVTVV